MSSFLLFHCLISNLFNFLYFVNSVYRYSSTSSSCFLGRDAGSSSGTPSATAPTSWFSVPIYSTNSSYAKQVLAIQTLTLVIKPCRTFLGQALSPWHQADALLRLLYTQCISMAAGSSQTVPEYQLLQSLQSLIFLFYPVCIYGYFIFSPYCPFLFLSLFAVDSYTSVFYHIFLKCKKIFFLKKSRKPNI